MSREPWTNVNDSLYVDNYKPKEEPTLPPSPEKTRVFDDFMTEGSHDKDNNLLENTLSRVENVVKELEVSGAVQSDWNQTDSTLPDYIKNKPSLSDYALKSEISPVVETALAEAKAGGEFKGDKGDKGDTGAAGKDGINGTNGVSATHSWNGTTLTITSASGTSSANLKGDKGDPGVDGEKGEKGTDGVNGVTPVRGTDYWTEADKSEIVNAVLSSLPQVDIVLTSEDGTSTTYRVYGEVVTQ